MMKSAFLSLAALMIASGASSAATRSISLSPPELFADTGAVQEGLWIRLPSAGTPSAFAQFILPPGYKKNSVVQVRLFLMQNGPACNVHLKKGVMHRLRQGHAPYTGGENINLVGGEVMALPAGSRIVVKTIEVRKPLAASFTNQKSKDAFKISIYRDKAEATDTCGTVFLQQAEVRYSVN